MDFWNFMIKKDDYICSFINRIIGFYDSLLFSRRKLLLDSKKRHSCSEKKRLFIVLNGPSINEQDLSLLKNEVCMFVNRGFMHPLYSIIKPQYHVFVDRKMLTGEWRLEWMDEIVDMNPNVIFIMPVSWAKKKAFKPYIDKGYNFYWIPFNTPASCLGVSGYCFDFAFEQKIKEIFFIGFDATGLANEVLKTTSHFYGVNEENNLKTTKNYIQDFYMFSRHLSDLHKIYNKSVRKNVCIYNATRGGLLDMFPRVKYEDLFITDCK